MWSGGGCVVRKSLFEARCVLDDGLREWQGRRVYQPTDTAAWSIGVDLDLRCGGRFSESTDPGLLF